MRVIILMASVWLTMTLSTRVYGQIEELSDEFHNACSVDEWSDINTIEGWNASHLEEFDINQSNHGFMTMMPWTTAWYQNYRSNLMFKDVPGDFIFTTRVTATNRAENDIPGSTYSLAGTMIRTPRNDIQNGLPDWSPGGENYVFLSLGYAATNHPTCSGCPGPHFEIKNTVNSNSSLSVSSIGVAEALIRVIRIDHAILVLYQLPGQPFVLHHRYNRSDMPDTLQVGLLSYTDWPKVSTYTPAFHNSNVLNANLNPDPSSNPGLAFNPDIIAQFDYARFETPQIPQHLQGLDFSDQSEVSDADVLALFDYGSTPVKFGGWKVWQGVDSDWNNVDNWNDGVIPGVQDSVLIPNCNCTEVMSPDIVSGNYEYASMFIEDGANMDIQSGSNISINLVGDNSQFTNHGVIVNMGQISIINSTSKTVDNRGTIECISTGLFEVLDN